MDVWANSLPISLLECERPHKPRRSYGKKRQYSGFRCRRCGSQVLNLPQLSGVVNRNHCPYCLWSRHLDLFHAGDRLSACKALMRPVGLALKISPKRYGSSLGELMLVHLCQDCGKASLNRIAADDDADSIMAVFSASLEDGSVCTPYGAWGATRLLQNRDISLVRDRLFGLSE